MIRSHFPEKLNTFPLSSRIAELKERMFTEPRYLSIEQALLITESYKQNEAAPRIIQRARAFSHAARHISITIDPDELIVGNRTAGVRAGVVFPEAGIGWLDKEIETLPDRPQDKFKVRPQDITTFREEILPYWRGKTLEDEVERRTGDEIKAMKRVIKINQTDHAQGHICPNVEKWLTLGPAGVKREAERALAGLTAKGDSAAEQSSTAADFYKAVSETLGGASAFMVRYAELAESMTKDGQGKTAEQKHNLAEIARICYKLAVGPPETFREAVQSVWFLFVLLQLESNASSFSPGRMDQYLYPFYRRDIDSGIVSEEGALEFIEALWLKFNQIVYLRNTGSATYFAGFPIGFNVAVGGQWLPEGLDTPVDAVNELSYLMLKAQEHLGLPQPNLSARLHENSPDEFIDECARVIGLGSGMPQIFNDESIIPALETQGISHSHAVDYAVVGCVELSTQGNNLGWSDAAMFNLVKVLELTLTGGRCLLSGEQIGIDAGNIAGYSSFAELEEAYRKQIAHFTERMIAACEVVDRLHADILPSPFLSSVIDNCIENGKDVTSGGAHYNLSGIQAIQAANVADSLAAVKKLIFDERKIGPEELLRALEADFEGYEQLRLILLNRVAKYGNDVAWVDELGARWVEKFAEGLKNYSNVRGGPYHTGLYTVSAHVPMGQNVGATPDGRKAGEPLADGGVSAMYGRDLEGPTALLKSVSRIPSRYGSNGTLLNMKFLPDFFETKERRAKFDALLRAFVRLRINHVQFNVVGAETLRAAQKNPEEYRSLTVRVAGYTAYFTELAGDLQNEIIARTAYGV
jgi:formate C-acetyltransferase